MSLTRGSIHRMLRCPELLQSFAASLRADVFPVQQGKVSDRDTVDQKEEQIQFFISETG